MVTNGMEVPSGAMALGVPAKLRETGRDLAPLIQPGMESYVARGARYRRDLRRLA